MALSASGLRREVKAQAACNCGEYVTLVPVSASQFEDSELEVRRCLILPTSASRPGGCGKASTADANEEAVGAVWLLAPSLFIYVFY